MVCWRARRGGPRRARWERRPATAGTKTAAGRAKTPRRPGARDAAVAQDARELTADGKVLLRLRRPWHDGTWAIRFEPSEFLEKLAVIIPRPRINLVLYHGAFAPRGRCHSGPGVVEDARQRATTPASASLSSSPEAETPPAPSVRPRHFAWADLLRRVFALDILACPDCGGRLRLLATIEDRDVVEKILTHLGLPVDPPRPDQLERLQRSTEETAGG